MEPDIVILQSKWDLVGFRVSKAQLKSYIKTGPNRSPDPNQLFSKANPNRESPKGESAPWRPLAIAGRYRWCKRSLYYSNEIYVLLKRDSVI